jgi:predicted aldo/keto reductase-like oxidoreductase
VSDPATYEQTMGPDGGYEAAVRARDAGKLRHIGVSIHRDLPTMRRAIDSGAFEALMLAYSVLDPEGSGELLPAAQAAGLGTVVMKPLSGGQLTGPPGPDGQPVAPDPVVAGALRWVLSNPHVTTVIPGMISAQQVEENVAAVERGPLSEAERREVIATVGALRKSYRYGQECLRCGYCQPCPEGIDAPAIFRAADMARDYPDELKNLGRELYEAQQYTAEHCVECRECVERCPVGIDIPQRLREAAEFFGQ